MKIITEMVDNENFVEIVLSDFDMDLLDDRRLLNKQIRLGNQFVSFGLRKSFLESENEKETDEKSRESDKGIQRGKAPFGLKKGTCCKK